MTRTFSPDVRDRLQVIFRDIFGDDCIRISPETQAKDIEGWDSLNHTRLIVSVEKAFGFLFTLSEILSLSEAESRVGDLLKIIETRRTS